MDEYRVVITIISIIIIGLIGVVYKTLSGKIDSKLEKEIYTESISHIKDAVSGINGTAKELRNLALGIAEIKSQFLEIKDFRAEMKIHTLECQKKCNENATKKMR